jgi:hypothetical protein
MDKMIDRYRLAELKGIGFLGASDLYMTNINNNKDFLFIPIDIYNIIWCKYEDVKELEEGVEGMRLAIGDLRDERDGLEEKLKVAREALEFYANEKKYRIKITGLKMCEIFEDEGKKAREALEKIKD